MSDTRASVNRTKIERPCGRSVVCVDPTEAIYQGDALVWNSGSHIATKAGPSATAFLGLSETKNPITTMGSPDLLGNLSNPLAVLIQSGMVEMIAEHAETLYPFDGLTIGSDAQHVSKLWCTNATQCFTVDPKWASASGKAVVAGDKVRCWIRVRPAYSMGGPAAAALA